MLVTSVFSLSPPLPVTCRPPAAQSLPCGICDGTVLPCPALYLAAVSWTPLDGARTSPAQSVVGGDERNEAGRIDVVSTW